MLFLNSCTPEKTELLTSKSNDGEMVVTVQGSRYSSMDPYEVQVDVAINDKVIEASTEVYADKLDASNVDFNWRDDRNLIIAFTHRDGKVTTVPVSVQE